MRSNVPAPVITGSAIRFTLKTMTNGQLCFTNFDYNYSTPPSVTIADLNNGITAWNTAFLTLYKAVVSPLTTFVSLSVSELSYRTTPTVVSLYAPGVVGTAGASNLPLEMAATFVKTSNLKGQHGRGRMSLPAIPNTFTTPATNANELNNTGITAYNALGSQVSSTLTVGGQVWVPFIFTRPVPPSVTIIQGVIMATCVVQTVLGTCRRRKEGRGI